MPQSFQEQLEAWTRRQLTDYVASLRSASPPNAPKEFNDPIWGTILLRPAEVLILDSPLMQRLRTIAQLGVVHLVYTAAGHSRLEHTLGVVHQVSRLVSSLNEHFDSSGDAVTAEQRARLRLTALCHDVGHGALSHVSENALETFEQIEDIALAFADDVEIESAALAEIAAYYMVGSPAFGEMLDCVQQLVPNHELGSRKDTITFMQRAIIGKPVSDEVPLLHELISGPFDADKLDYMTRDAHMTGVPVVTDIRRLVQKVRAVRVSRQNLRTEIAATVEAREHYVVTGIAFSGGRTVDELILGRTLQQDKLYRHHKVRAIEAMVASMYRQLGSIAPDLAPMMPYELLDSDFTTLSERRIEDLIGRPIKAEERGPAEVAIDLASRLRRRTLFVRAYAFSLGMPLDPYRADADHFTGLERLARESGNDFPQRGHLIDSIVVELRRALDLDRDYIETTQPTLPPYSERYPDLKPYIWLDPLYAMPRATDSARAYLISPEIGEQKVLRFQDDYAETVRWANAYILTRDAGYVFTPADLASYTFAATEKVLRREYDIRTPPAMLIWAKQNPNALTALKERLEKKEFYEGIAYDVCPLPPRLRKADIRSRVDAFCTTMRGYEGPVRDGVADKKRTLLSGERTLAWLRQFPSEFEDEPLVLLEETRLVSRHEVIAAVRGFLQTDEAKSFSNAAICPLGAPKDSSAVTTYWAGDQRGPADLDVLSLGDALARKDLPLLFVEDFIGSGQQSVSILEAWLAEPPTTKLGEARDPLPEATANQFRARRLAFVFAAGRNEGAELLRSRCAELGLSAHVHVGSDDAPRAFATANVERRERLRAYCAEVGRELLLDPVAGHDQEWVSHRVLGYGNDAFLVVFGYNTPTQTLTCMWKDGTFRGLPWMPLFPRRAKR